MGNQTQDQTRKRPRQPFNVKELEHWKIPGTFCDGDAKGLYLQVRPTKDGEVSKCWIFRYRDLLPPRKLRDMGLGILDHGQKVKRGRVLTLAQARAEAKVQADLLAQFKDPIQERERRRAEAVEAGRKSMTFKAAAELYWERQKAGWKSEKEATVWLNRMRTHAFPALGSREVRSIRMEHVLAALDPIWREKTETAREIRGYLENVFDFCKGRGLFVGDNPAAWKGNLKSQLPEAAKIHKTENQPALDYRQIGAFMDAVRSMPEISYRALEFTILTACRSNEVLGACWDEVDLAAAEWTIPGERMKKDKEHVVPLSPRALEILQVLEKVKKGPFVFPGAKSDQTLSSAAMLEAIKEMHRKRLREDSAGWVDAKGNRITAHGFRSTFRDWAANRTEFPREVMEYALAHKLPDRVEAAYQRTTLFEKRRLLMEAWDAYCAIKDSGNGNGKVIPIRGAV